MNAPVQWCISESKRQLPKRNAKPVRIFAMYRAHGLKVKVMFVTNIANNAFKFGNYLWTKITTWQIDQSHLVLAYSFQDFKRRWYVSRDRSPNDYLSLYNILHAQREWNSLSKAIAETAAKSSLNMMHVNNLEVEISSIKYSMRQRRVSWSQLDMLFISIIQMI